MTIKPLLAAPMLAFALIATAQAQIPGIPSVRTGLAAPKRPTVSPYLNLLRRDGGIGFQYYRQLLPQREFREAIEQQGQALRSLNRQIEEIDRPTSPSLGGGLGRTGHPTAFQSYGGSFGGTAGRGSSPRPRR